MGVEIRRGLAVEAFDQSDDGVAVRAGGETFHGRWLVGCDGGRSTVRKAGGFAFVGTDPEFTGYSVDVELDRSGPARPGRHYTPTGMYTYARPGTIAMVAFDGGAFHRTQPITPEHVEAVLRHVSGTDVTLTGARACDHLDGSRLPGDGLPPRARAARRRRRAHPFAAGRPGPQPRTWRCDEPRVEAGRHDPRRRAGRPARQLLRANGIQSERRFSIGRAPRSR